MKNISNLVLIGLVVLLSILSAGLFYYSRSVTKDNTRIQLAIKASNDTLHTFKTKFNSQGGYISQIVGDKNELIGLLSKEESKNKDLLQLLDSNKNVQTAVDVRTETKTQYISIIDTTFKGISFTHTIHEPWLDEVIKVDSDRLTRDLSYRDAYLFHTDKKDNKGLFTGSTLTTYVEPKNPNTKVTGITSVSTIIDKRKPRLGVFVGPGGVVTPQGKVYGGITVGFGLTF